MTTETKTLDPPGELSRSSRRSPGSQRLREERVARPSHVVRQGHWTGAQGRRDLRRGGGSQRRLGAAEPGRRHLGRAALRATPGHEPRQGFPRTP
jgi:hypothetical protein